jgi:FtsH-binding integral membrane protein
MASDFGCAAANPIQYTDAIRAIVRNRCFMRTIMAFETDRQPLGRGYTQPRGWADTGVAAGEVDQGLRKYLLGVYNYMASGLLLSGVVALTVANTSLLNLFFQVQNGRMGYTGLGWVAILAPLGLIFFMNVNRQPQTLKILYWVFVALMGVSLSALLLAYTGVSVARTFFITAISFGGLSLYGYTTKRDMSGMRSFFVMGVIGLMVAMLVSMFVASSALQFTISVVGVLLFAGLTAYDTQNLKRTYYAVNGSSVQENSAIMGAVQLYLDFINMFQFLLMFLGNRR